LGVIIKQSFWGTVISYTGVIIGYFVSLYLKPKYFDLDEIGVLTLITSNAMIVSSVSSFGFSSSFIKFFPSFRENKNAFFSFLLLLTVISNVVELTISFALKEWIISYYADSPEYIPFLAVTGLVVIANSLFELLYSYCRSVLNVINVSLIREIYIRLGVMVLILLYGFGNISFTWAMNGVGIVYFSAFLILALDVFYAHKFQIDFSFNFYSRKWLASLLNFSTYAMLLGLSFAVINNISYTQITNLLGSAATGIYTTCFFIGVIVEMPKRNMSKVIGPVISKSFQANDLGEIQKVYARSSITMGVIGGLLCIGIISNVNDLFLFIPKGSAFAEGFWVVVWVCLAKFGLMITGFPGEIISFSPYYKFNLYFQAGSAIIMVLLNLVLIPQYGLNGTGLAYFISTILLFFSRLFFVIFRYRIHPFDVNHLYLFGILLALGLIAYLFNPGLHPILNIFIKAGLTTLVFVLLIYKLHISKDINNLIHSTLNWLNFDRKNH
jgi:O-antigen/teichoic acid export membrane protein